MFGAPLNDADLEEELNKLEAIDFEQQMVDAPSGLLEPLVSKTEVKEPSVAAPAAVKR